MALAEADTSKDMFGAEPHPAMAVLSPMAVNRDETLASHRNVGLTPGDDGPHESELASIKTTNVHKEAPKHPKQK